LLTTYQKVMTRLDSLSPLGYSCAGTVVAVGHGVADLHVGDAVACAGAGYSNHAELIFVPRNLVAKIPAPPVAHNGTNPSGHNGDHVSPGAGSAIAFEVAAFTTVGAIALQGVRQAQPALGETVAVIGLGLIGLLTVQLLRASGCRVLGMDLSSARCALAELLSAEGTAASAEQMQALVAHWSGGAGADAVIITASTKSNAPIELAAELCRERGRVVAVGLVGLNVPRKPFYDKELDLRLSRSYGPGRYDPAYEEQGHDYPIGYVRWTENRNMQAFLDLLAQGKLQVQPLISHRFSIEAATEAYELITGEQAGTALGVILSYPEPTPQIQAAKVVRLDQGTANGQLRSSAKGASVRVGLIGSGAFAQGTLLPALASIDGARLSAVCSASGLSARHVAEKYSASYCTADADHLIRDPEINAVLIATRHGSHAALAIRALASGKPVFVEKPLAVSEEQLAAVALAFHAAQRRDVAPTNGSQPHIHTGAPTLLVGFNRRFAPLALAMRAFLADAGPLAVHYRVNAGPVPPDSWLHNPVEGGGRIVGEVCHFVDFLQFLTGAAPVRVSAAALPTQGGAALEDNVSIQIVFGDGSVGSILYAADGDKAFPKERVEAFGGGCVAVLDDFRSLELVKGGRRHTERSFLRQDKGHAAEIGAFIDAAQRGGPSPISFASLVLTTLTTLRIREALRTGLPQPIDVQAVAPHFVACQESRT
jgi:polar amino acid transport system substrate-binding protein